MEKTSKEFWGTLQFTKEETVFKGKIPKPKRFPKDSLKKLFG